MVGLQLLFLFFVTFVEVAESQIPSFYDSRSIWKEHCSGFSIVQDQGNCSSCCAMALSSALSARECMRDKRNVVYSAEQIWDCAGPSSSATCATGSILDNLISALGRGIYSAKGLIKNNCSLYSDREASTGTCETSFRNCSADPDGPSQIEGSVFYDLTWFSGNPEFGAWAASRSMMSEILANGPVVSVISLTANELILFNSKTYLRNKTVFVPDVSNSTQIPPFRHCLMVYGWGQDTVTGLNYWLVQNSWGESWADGGTARILRGMNLLETEWRGVSTSPRPCIKGNLCLNISSINSKISSSSSVGDLFHNNMRQMSYQAYTLIGGGMSNFEILGITLGSSLFISTLIYLFVFPPPKRKSAKMLPPVYSGRPIQIGALPPVFSYYDNRAVGFSRDKRIVLGGF